MFRKVLLAISLLFVTACAEVKLTIPYTPQSTQEISGEINIENFTYSPTKPVAQNEIRETAAGRILLTDNVGDFITNAVRREFRQSGISLKPTSRCVMKGDVKEFLIDSLGFSSDYKTDIQYIIGIEKDVIFDKRYIVEFNASKFVTAEIIIANINKSISDNIDQLLNDSFFLKVLKEHC